MPTLQIYLPNEVHEDNKRGSSITIGAYRRRRPARINILEHDIVWQHRRIGRGRTQQ